MGNCLFGGGLGEGDEDGVVIKVVTSNGGIMELLSPITVGSITNEFPGHGIFRSHDLFWKPLCEQEELVGGESYYLLPLSPGGEEEEKGDQNNQMAIREGHIRSNSVLPTTTHTLVAPYRMSLSVDYQRYSSMLKTHPFSTSTSSSSSSSSSRAMMNSRRKSTSSSSSSGFWKVKLVISPQQLLEILSQENLTHQLIESGRTVAKCRTSITRNTAASLSLSDHWSLSGSCRKASSDGLLHI